MPVMTDRSLFSPLAPVAMLQSLGPPMTFTVRTVRTVRAHAEIQSGFNSSGKVIASVGLSWHRYRPALYELMRVDNPVFWPRNSYDVREYATFRLRRH